MAGTWTYTESTNTVVVTGGTSGTPATFADFVHGDRTVATTACTVASGAELLAALTCTTGHVLTYPMRPVEFKALRLAFTLASTSAGAGDTIDIYGTTAIWCKMSGASASGQKVVPCADLTHLFQVGDTVRLIDISAPATTETDVIASISEGVSITLTNNNTNAYAEGDIVGIDLSSETIDASGGDATYWSANSYGQIAYFDCTGWADGTVKVDQPIWGVIWDCGLSQYQLDCYFTCGNGSTATYFRTDNETITWSTGFAPKSGHLLMTANATFASGKITEGLGVDGSVFNFWPDAHIFTVDSWVGLQQYYGCRINIKTGNRYYLYPPAANCDCCDTVINFETGTNDVFLPGSFTFKRGVVASTDAGGVIEYYGSSSLINTVTNCSTLQSWIAGSDMIADGLVLTNTTTQSLRMGQGRSLMFKDMELAPTLITIDNAAGRIDQEYGLNINMTDGSGAALEGVAVIIQDQYDNIVSCVDSGANLNEALDSSETGINVTDGTKFSVNDVIKIYNEFMLVTGISTNTLTVTRGYYAEYTARAHNPYSGIDVFIVGSVPTDASGDIEEQTVLYKEWHGTSETLTTYSPHKFTFSKAGYQTLIHENDTVDHKINWHLELQPLPYPTDAWRQDV